MLSTLKSIDQLPIRHRLFILGYLHHKGDKTKAARVTGCPPKRAKEHGYQLYTKLHLYIETLSKEFVEAYALRAEQVVQGLSLLASSDIKDFLTWDAKKNKVTFVDFDTLTPAQRFCIEGVKQKTSQWGDTIELRLAKKQPALETLALYHNLLKRPLASKGLIVKFEDGTVVGGTKAQWEVLEHTRRKVAVTFTNIPAGPAMKQGG